MKRHRYDVKCNQFEVIYMSFGLRRSSACRYASLFGQLLTIWGCLLEHFDGDYQGEEDDWNHLGGRAGGRGPDHSHSRTLPAGGAGRGPRADLRRLEANDGNYENGSNCSDLATGPSVSLQFGAFKLSWATARAAMAALHPPARLKYRP